MGVYVISFSLWKNLVGRRQSIEWPGMEEHYSLPASILRRRLFDIVINGDPREAMLASECLIGIDETRSKYGQAESGCSSS